ncbi:hypothetical protein ACPV34_19170 [Photobacterium damselae]|uniref:hypothetical protein n=1 Tax=Photobacterium damselae TaxID=38293 RepID=UPI0010FD767D|nr:hypothetical protein [Photobacterium damselae]TLS69677.1 hypothetical protein FD718_11145 [Photobacterium damselae subsp. damselae]
MKIEFSVKRGSDITPVELKAAGVIMKDFKLSISKSDLDNIKGFHIQDCSTPNKTILSFIRIW